jgi:hypothetical protein
MALCVKLDYISAKESSVTNFDRTPFDLKIHKEETKAKKAAHL